jgi:predicted ABC-type exoprotein transport system permease subunit
MGSFSLMHWLIIAIILATVLAPIARILGRAGFSRWWCILWAIPLLNIIALWVFAFARWPALEIEPIRRAPLALGRCREAI